MNMFSLLYIFAQLVFTLFFASYNTGKGLVKLITYI